MDISSKVNLCDGRKDLYYTRNEAAAFLRVKPATLAKWCTTKRYDLPYHKCGHSKVLYKIADLEAFLEKNRKRGRNE